jgi:hypothetical protein
MRIVPKKNSNHMSQGNGEGIDVVMSGREDSKKKSRP